jgi:hypothetical protein
MLLNLPGDGLAASRLLSDSDSITVTDDDSVTGPGLTEESSGFDMCLKLNGNKNSSMC